MSVECVAAAAKPPHRACAGAPGKRTGDMFIPLHRTTVSAIVGAYAKGELDFAGAHIEHADLRDRFLDSVNLCGARLAGADARGAHLTGAYLSFINLYSATLQSADLRKC